MFFDPFSAFVEPFKLKTKNYEIWLKGPLEKLNLAEGNSELEK